LGSLAIRLFGASLGFVVDLLRRGLGCVPGIDGSVLGISSGVLHVLPGGLRQSRTASKARCQPGSQEKPRYKSDVQFFQPPARPGKLLLVDSAIQR
jgi:hypothetical protein